jgi:hypothetical protein
MSVRTIVIAALIAGTIPVFAQPPAGSEPRTAGPSSAQAPRATTPPATAPQAPATLVRRQGQPVNVKIDVTISDQNGAANALKKTVSVVTGDGLSGFIRSEANYSNIGPVPLNIDTEPEILTDGKIRVRVNLQYDLPGGSGQMPEAGTVTGRLNKTQIRENLAVILESGKPLIIAQSADPVGDRQVTIEVKATILR